MNDDSPCIDDLKSPWLGVVAARSPSRGIQDLFDLRQRPWHGLELISGQLRQLGRQPGRQCDFDPLPRVRVSAAQLLDDPPAAIRIELMIVWDGADPTAAK